MICPNQPLHGDAYRRFGSAGEPLRWYNSQPAKWGPLMSHFSRLPSDVRTNAPLRVPTNNRTALIVCSFSSSLWLLFSLFHSLIELLLGPWFHAHREHGEEGFPIHPGQVELQDQEEDAGTNARRLQENMERDDIDQDRHDQNQSQGNEAVHQQQYSD